MNRHSVKAIILAVCHLDLKFILIIGFLLRLFWVLLIPIIPVSDSVAYDTFALNIVHHGTYGWNPEEPTSFWPVGTSAIYGLLYFAFGHSYSAVAVFNIMASLGIIYLTYSIVSISFSRSAASLAALFFAINPTFIFFCTVLASELPFMLFSMLGIYAYHRSKQYFWLVFVSAIAFGIAYYIRSLAIPIVIVWIFSEIFFFKREVWGQVVRGLVVLVGVFLLALPWIARNYDLYGHYSSMSSNGGVVFWMGNTPNTNGGYMPIPDDVKAMDEYQRNKILKERAVNFIQEEPIQFIGRTFSKFYQFHAGETIGVTWNEEGISRALGEEFITPLKALTYLFWLLCLLGSVLGCALYFIREGFLGSISNPMLLLWMSSAGIHSLIAAQDRYHMSIFPFMVAYFAYFCISLLQSRSSKDTLTRLEEGRYERV